MYNLLTYEEAVLLTQNGVNPSFYELKYKVDGYNISMFNYRLAEYKDFHNPIENSDIKGYEMRGLTFVFNKDGSLFKRYLLLNKFFNMNQTPETAYDVIKDYEIKYVNFKEDGSVSSFIKLPNGKVIGKSKMSVESEQAEGIMRVYNRDENIRKFVNYCLDNGYDPIFEYVAPHNRIVLRYKNEELILLKVRDTNTGEYIPLERFEEYTDSIKTSNFFHNVTLDQLIEWCKLKEGIEGYVVECIDKNGNTFLYKLKTIWYVERHGLLSEDLYREHILIGYILDNKIDDIIGQIPDDEVESFERIDKLIHIVKNEIDDKVGKAKKLYNIFSTKYKSDRKSFALSERKHPFFHYVMSYLNGIDFNVTASSEIGKRCGKLVETRDWVRRRDPSILKYYKENKEG